MQDNHLKMDRGPSLQFALHNPDANVSFLNYSEVGVQYLVLIAMNEWSHWRRLSCCVVS